MDSTYKSELLGSLHETAVGLHQIGVINDAEMREYDRNCLSRKDETVSGASRHQSINPVFAKSPKGY